MEPFIEAMRDGRVFPTARDALEEFVAIRESLSAKELKQRIDAQIACDSVDGWTCISRN
jgi:hypothetical protein